MADVFVSYKTEERAVAARVVAALCARGYSVWWDQHLTLRAVWDAEIETELDEARAVLVLWSSKAAAQGTFVRKEALRAWDKGKYVPAWIERCDLPLAFTDRQTADLTAWDYTDQSHPEWAQVLAWIAEAMKGAEFCGGAGLPLMVMVPPGTFQMGSPRTEKGRNEDEWPQREVRIGYSLAVGKFPVTVEEWWRFIDASGYRWRTPERFREGDRHHPVTMVSRHDAEAYAAWVSQRTGQPYCLPSEAEWEYACRARTTTRYSFGDDLPRAYWASRGTEPVGSSREVNAFGLFDMHGNVSEWVKDQYSANYCAAPQDGSARSPLGLRGYGVVRGGSWALDPKERRSASRRKELFVNGYIDIGFRLAMTCFAGVRAGTP